MTLGGSPRSRRGPSGAVGVWSFVPMSALSSTSAPTLRELEVGATLTFRRVTPEGEFEAAARTVEAFINSPPPFEDLAAALRAHSDRLAEPLRVWENEGGAL